MSALTRFDFSAIPAIPASPGASNSTNSRNSQDVDNSPSPEEQAAADVVRARLLAEFLAGDPRLVRGVEVIDFDTNRVWIMVAIRDVGTCELSVDRERWDPMAFLALVESGAQAES